MTQVYFMTRGHKTWIDQWITELQGKYLPYEYNGQKGMLQIILRPIQLWEVAFPEEHRDIVYNSIFNKDLNFGLHQSDWKGKIALSFLRKSLNAKKIKKWDITKQWMPLTRQGMSVIGIGERQDKINFHPETGKPNEGI